MARGWPFLSATLRLIEMALAEADPAIAAAYDRALVPDELKPIGEDLRARLDLARRSVLDVLDARELLADNPVLRRSIDVRNPYVDPINIVQIALLARLRGDEAVSAGALAGVPRHGQRHRGGDEERGVGEVRGAMREVLDSSMALAVTPSLVIADSELEESFVRASGPGGRNVNKVSTAVQLRYDVGRSTLDGEVRARLRKLAGSRMTRRGRPDDRRARASHAGQNREDARARLVDLIRQALVRAQPPQEDAPHAAAKQRRPGHASRVRWPRPSQGALLGSACASMTSGGLTSDVRTQT